MYQKLEITRVNSPAISIVMSIYNEDQFIIESIDSILNQSYKNFELIIINDASTDKTAKIIDNYSQYDKRIIILNNDKNIGLTKSLNRGIRIAKGKYIARQDADDISFPDRFKEQYNFLEKNKNIFLCGTDYNFIDEEGFIIKHQINSSLLNAKDIENELPKRNIFIHTSVMFRNENIYYREKFYYSQDYDLYLNLLTLGKKLANINKKLVLWRMNEPAISYKNNNEQKLFAEKAREFYFQRKKYGRDKYDKFNPTSIFSIKTPDQPQKNILEDKIILLLENCQFNEAKKIYTQQYARKRNINPFRKIAIRIFVNCPIIYKIYRKIRYYSG